MKKYLFILWVLFSLILIGCGGGSSSSQSGMNSSELPTVSGYGIVTDVLDMDLNNDGNNDLVLFRTADEPFYSGLYIQALINNGDESFIDETSTYFQSIGNNWSWIDKAYLVDLNGDGLMDIVGHVDQGTLNLPPLIRKSTGEFEITTNTVLVNNSGGMIPIDSDADGDIDILVRTIQNFGQETSQVHQWTLLLNITTAGEAIEFQSQGIVSSGDNIGWDYSAFVYSPIIMDINNDGYQDFVYGGPKYKNGDFVNEDAPINIYINSKSNTYIQSTSQVFVGTIPSYTHVREMLSADLNNNGYEDILIANTGYDKEPYPGQKNAILTNQGMGIFEETTISSSIHNYEGFTHSTDIGDIDGDGDLDIVYTDILGNDVSESKKVRILENDGTGVFTIKSFKSLGSNSWTSTKLADLNNDAYPDLVLGGIDSGSKSVIIWNDGLGNF